MHVPQDEILLMQHRSDHSYCPQRVLNGGAKWGCYGLVLVPALEILSGGAEHPLDTPRPRLVPALTAASRAAQICA